MPTAKGNSRRVVGGGRQQAVVEADGAYGFQVGVGVRVRDLWLLGEGSMTDDLRGDA